MAGLHGQVLSGRRQDLDLHGLRPSRRADDGSGPEAMRRRSHARERDAAVSQLEGYWARDAPAGGQAQYQRDRLLPDRADADGTLYRRILRVVRPGHYRRCRRLVRQRQTAENSTMLGSIRRARGTQRRKDMQLNKRILLASIAAGVVAMAGPALAQKKYDVGANDKEIKIGNINPYSGPASAYG